MLARLAEILEAVPVVTLVAGVVMLLLGGYWLVEGASRVAKRLGVSPLLIGLTVVAFGTSSPELAFNLASSLADNSELAFGNVVGSNIANIALVLGLAALTGPIVVHSRVLRRELPALIIASGVMLAVAWISLTPWDDTAFSRVEGTVLLCGFVIVSWLWYRMSRQDRRDTLLREAQEEVTHDRNVPLGVSIVLIVIGLVALVGGGKFAELGAVGVAEWLGLAQSVVGLTIVAVATSLPEIATSVVAAKKGHGDIAVGNIVGSNLFNILLVFGLTSLISPIALPQPWGSWDLIVMMILTLLLVPIGFTAGNRVTRAEGIFLLVCYAAYVTFTVIR